MAEQLSSLNGSGPATTNKPPCGDLTPLQLQEFLDEYDDLDEQAKRINGKRRDLRKRIDGVGAPLSAFDNFRKQRKIAGSLRERDDAAYRQMMAWDNKPVGLQASMDLTTSAGSPALNVAELKRIDSMAAEAAKAKKGRQSNPYTPSTEAHQRWDTAYLRTEGEAASDPAPAARKPGRPRKGAEQ